jgi:deazaflavin-dependent oxidoreductase (nitroreductase family)
MSQRLANAWLTFLIKRGLGADYRHILTVAGRKSGLSRSTPVDVMTIAGQRFLIAPYGETNWVRNVRAAGRISLRRGRSIEPLRAVEIAGADAVAPIRLYIRTIRVTRPYWEVGLDASDAEIAAAAGKHPVFQLRTDD